MESPQDQETSIINSTVVKIVVVGVLVIILIAVFFIATKGNDISFCLFSPNCNKPVVINPPPDPVGFDDLLAAGAGVTTAAVLTAIIDAPITVAVGVGIAIWWIVNALLH
ncbi:hypothetical protein FJR11_13295 [Anabaena sp. UHCC 0187]|uniref:hypothetical protein n=1 Tax=Anabaena sp. UHCC 0187 TaxID=2590018 RepID=UPI001446B616|nr:hypothetical protein [Anabaena sp. UHCC 0187]MTJ13546.1 hypothetical protein [Anabaena sp. UHCC 0187]